MAINVAAELMQAGDEMRAALARIGDVYRELNLLPAPGLTEQAIVDALKADPSMAGRVMAVLADKLCDSEILDMSGAARVTLSSPACSPGAYVSLQSLAVALAAASYRG